MTSRRLLLNRRQFHAQAATGAAALAVGTPLVFAAEKKQWLAGAAETVATPAAKGTFLIGPMKPSTGVNDDLFARALVWPRGTSAWQSSRWTTSGLTLPTRKSY